MKIDIQVILYLLDNLLKSLSRPVSYLNCINNKHNFVKKKNIYIYIEKLANLI